MPRASFGLFKRETERGGEGYLVQWRAGLKAEQSWAPGKPWLVTGRSWGPVKPSWVHRRSRSSWSSWSVRTDAWVRTEEAEDRQADVCWRMRGSKRTRAGGRAGPGREWGRNTSRVCLSLSLPNPLPLSQSLSIPARFPLYACAGLETTEGGRSPARERFPALGPFPFLREAAHANGDRLRLVGVAPNA
jgi:hypothetical protein